MIVCTGFIWVHTCTIWVCTLILGWWTGFCEKLLWMCHLGRELSEAKQAGVCWWSCAHVDHARCTCTLSTMAGVQLQEGTSGPEVVAHEVGWVDRGEPTGTVRFFQIRSIRGQKLDLDGLLLSSTIYLMHMWWTELWLHLDVWNGSHSCSGVQCKPDVIPSTCQKKQFHSFNPKVRTHIHMMYILGIHQYILSHTDMYWVHTGMYPVFETENAALVQDTVLVVPPYSGEARFCSQIVGQAKERDSWGSQAWWRLNGPGNEVWEWSVWVCTGTAQVHTSMYWYKQRFAKHMRADVYIT